MPRNRFGEALAGCLEASRDKSRDKSHVSIGSDFTQAGLSQTDRCRAGREHREWSWPWLAYFFQVRSTAARGRATKFP